MCDYSLQEVASRPAKVGDRLVSTRFPNSITRGFSAPGEPNVAVCLLPGTEIAFDRKVEYLPAFGYDGVGCTDANVARFRQVDLSLPHAHHDALEFPDGVAVLVTRLVEGQHATVLQLPATAQPLGSATAEEKQEDALPAA